MGEQPSSASAVHPEYVTVQLALFSELCDAMRARSDPEYIYTAASIGSFGAVAWGIAALSPDKYCDKSLLLQPAVVAAVGIALSCIAVILKIIREARVFRALKAERARIAAKLACVPGANFDIPPTMLSQTAGRGYAWSLVVIVASASASILFCMAIATASIPTCPTAIARG